MTMLVNVNIYPSATADVIESMGTTAITIANRWMIGWPERVKCLLAEGTYLDCLESQLDQEKEVLANEGNLRHLSRREVLQIYEIRESPPVSGLT